jgi:trimeric autotransporter adhesin
MKLSKLSTSVIIGTTRILFAIAIASGYAADLSDVDWESMGVDLAGPNGPVTAIVKDPNGNTYIGGLFTKIGSFAVTNVAKWDGSKWSALAAGVDGAVARLAFCDNELYVAGVFTHAGAISTPYLARWDGSAWSSLGTGVNSNVYALAVSSGVVYVGGRFTSAGGVPTPGHLAKWDGSQWSDFSPGMSGLGFQSIQALAVSGDKVHVGGTTTSQQSAVAQWDGNSWITYPAAGLPTKVYTLGVVGGEVYAGGNGLAKWDGVQWGNVGGFELSSGTIYTLIVTNTSVLVGGSFTRIRIDRVATDAKNFAVYSGHGWSTLLGFDKDVYSLAVFGTNIAAVGAFSQALVSGQPWNQVNSVAITDGGKWAPLGSYNLGLAGGGVWSLTSVGSTVYAGGLFTSAGGDLKARNVAKWDGQKWSAMGLSGTRYGVEPVTALAIHGDQVFAGGHITAWESVLFAQGLVQWDGNEWGWMDATNVNALAIYENNLVVGTANGIGRWDGASWSSLGSGIDGYFDRGSANALVVSGTNLYVGGKFSYAGGTNAANIAKWDGSQWSALGSGVDGVVRAVAVVGTNLYVAGDFKNAGGVSASQIAKWDGNRWSALKPQITGTVNALASFGKDLYVGGLFLSGSKILYTLKWDGIRWSTLGSDVDGMVRALTVADGYLIAGGDFSHAGGKTAISIARYRIAEPIRVVYGPVIQDGGFVVRFVGVPGTSFTVESTDDLARPFWVKRTNLILPESGPLGPGVIEFQDSHTSAPSRFFRVITPAY